MTPWGGFEHGPDVSRLGFRFLLRVVVVRTFVRPGLGAFAMTAVHLIAAVVSVGLLGYLTFAMLCPEKF
jgi:K+-transporting ATPase KdpF subunit